MTKIPRAMKIHKPVIQIAFVMHREENDCVILAFDAKYKFSFSISSILNDLSFDLYRRFQDSPVGSKKGHDFLFFTVFVSFVLRSVFRTQLS